MFLSPPFSSTFVPVCSFYSLQPSVPSVPSILRSLCSFNPLFFVVFSPVFLHVCVCLCVKLGALLGPSHLTRTHQTGKPFLWFPFEREGAPQLMLRPNSASLHGDCRLSFCLSPKGSCSHDISGPNTWMIKGIKTSQSVCCLISVRSWSVEKGPLWLCHCLGSLRPSFPPPPLQKENQKKERNKTHAHGYISRFSSREVRTRVPFFLMSILVVEPSPKKGNRALLGDLEVLPKDNKPISHMESASTDFSSQGRALRMARSAAPRASSDGCRPCAVP